MKEIRPLGHEELRKVPRNLWQAVALVEERDRYRDALQRIADWDGFRATITIDGEPCDLDNAEAEIKAIAQETLDQPSERTE